jgi:predicted PurR-regulated permease PerM
MMRSNPDRFAELLFYGVVVLVGYLAFTVIQPFLGPLAWAAIFALTLNPVRRRLAARMPPGRAALATTFLAAVLIVGPLATLVSMLASEIPQAVEFLKTLPETATPERVQRLWNVVRERSPVALPADPTMLLSQAAQAAVAFLAPQLGGVVANIAATLGSLFVMLFALFFLLRDGEHIAELVRRLLPFQEEERERLVSETRDLVIASVGAGLTVSAVQGFIGGIAFWTLGAGAPVAWGVAIFLCSLIPVVGATLVWVPVAAWWLLSGEIVRGVALVIVGAGVIGLVDNILRPMLLSGRTSVNGLVVFIGLLGGVSAFGFVGLVLGPVALVIAGTLLDALTRRIRRVTTATTTE